MPLLLLSTERGVRAEDDGMIQKLAKLEAEVSVLREGLSKATAEKEKLVETIVKFVSQGEVTVKALPKISVEGQRVEVLGLPPHFSKGATISWHSTSFGALPQTGSGVILDIAGSWVRLRVTTASVFQGLSGVVQIGQGATCWICVPTQQVAWD